MTPVHQKEDGTWWFWDEVWSDRFGPYDSYEEAANGCQAYARYLDDGQVPMITFTQKWESQLEVTTA